MDKTIQLPLRARENKPTALRAREMPPLVAGATTFAPVGSVSLDSQSSMAPYESSSFATPEGEVLAALILEMLMRRLLLGGL